MWADNLLATKRCHRHALHWMTQQWIMVCLCNVRACLSLLRNSIYVNVYKCRQKHHNQGKYHRLVNKVIPFGLVLLEFHSNLISSCVWFFLFAQKCQWFQPLRIPPILKTVRCTWSHSFSARFRLSNAINFKRIHCPNLQFNFRSKEHEIFSL